MAHALRELIEAVDITRQRVSSCAGPQLSSSRLRGEVRGLVDRYFADVRPAIAPHEQQAAELRIVDQCFQSLLQYSHRNTTVARYKTTFKALRAGLVEYDRIATATPAPAGPIASELDAKIVAVLERLVPSAALSYRQALEDLKADSRHSWRGPATDFRESLRETLDHLAPDGDVMAAPGFALEKDLKGPSMKQKVRYILKKRGLSAAAASTSEHSATAVDEAVGAMIRSVYTRSSVSTHTPTDKTEVLRIRDWVRVTLSELLEVRA